MKAAYPVIFTRVKDTLLIEVVDMDILTEGKSLGEAIEMARDAIGLKGISYEDAGIPIPTASDVSCVDVKNGTWANEGESFLSLVDVDFLEYRKKVDNRAVRRNVTLPNWLNQEAEKAGINVSKTLQEALISKLKSTKG